MKIFKISFSFAFILLSTFALGNQQKADSLKYEITQTPNQIKKAFLELEYGWEIKYLNVDESISTNRIALGVLNAANNKEGIALAYSYLGVYMYLIDSIPEAISYLQISESLLASQDNPERLAKVYNNLGVFYSSIYDYESALEYYHRSLQIKKEYIPNAEITSNLINIGSILYDQGKYQECIDINESSLIYALDHDDYESIAVIYTNLSAAHDRMSNHKKSTNYALKALDLYQNRLNNKSREAQVYSNLGANYLSQLQYSDAKYYFNQALETNLKLNKTSSLAIDYNNLAELERQQKNYAEAEKLAMESMRLAQLIDFEEEIKNAYHVLSLIEEDQGKYKTSLEYFKQYISLNDSILDRENSNYLEQLVLQNKLAVKQLQENQDEIAKEVFNKKTSLMTSFFIFLLSLICIWIGLLVFTTEPPHLVIAFLNYLIPFLLSAVLAMYILLKTDLPLNLSFGINLLILTFDILIGVLLHLILNHASSRKLNGN